MRSVVVFFTWLSGPHRRTVLPLIVLTMALSNNAPAASPPVVAGFNVIRAGDASLEEQGQLLLGELNCIACHKSENTPRLELKGAPDLSRAGERMTPQYLRAYLAKPHDVKPGATMPDVFHASEPQIRDGAADLLTHFLVSLGGPIKSSAAEGSTTLVDAGRTLYHTVGCVACHAPEKAGEVKVPSVPIGPQAMKTTVEQLADFLLDPLVARPHGRMPSSNLAPEEARAIAVYLLRDQLTNPQPIDKPPVKTKGLRYSLFEGVDLKDATLETFEALKPTSTGIASKINLDFKGRRANDHFAVRFTGSITIPREGKYTFYTGSDDGSRLYIDQKPVVDNDGTHSATEKPGDVSLTAGEHAIDVTYFENAGEESLIAGWKGPGLAKQVIPATALSNEAGVPMIPLQSEKFTVDAAKAEMGGRMFGALGCANCHALPNTGFRTAMPLARLNIESPGGCSGATPAKGLPAYEFDADQRAAIISAVKALNGAAKPFVPAERVNRTMAQMNCFACHERDKLGGPGQDRAAHFVMTANFDMGEEGRIPPGLRKVGAKLLPLAMDAIIFEGKLHVRQNRMATRMPRFSRASAGNIIDAFAQADAATASEPAPFDNRMLKDGRFLVGNKGLGCVNCHGVSGTPSLGMPSIDLSTVHDRIRPEWFHDLLVNPAAKNPGTRMPAFWFNNSVSFNDVAGGTVDGQIKSIWMYLSLGKDMPLPAGLQPTGGYELVPVDSPIVHRTFMKDVGPRAILVGYPDNLHVAFDADAVRLAKAWKGKFFEASGMWEGRGGKMLGPLGRDVIDLPAGPSFATLASADAPWPVAAPKARNVGGQFHGYNLDNNMQPIFRYELNGVAIQEKDVPLLRSSGAVLVRRFQLDAKRPTDDLYLFAAAGGKIEAGKEKDEWRIDDKLTLRFNAGPSGAAIRDGAGRKELLVPVKFVDGTATIEVEMSW